MSTDLHTTPIMVSDKAFEDFKGQAKEQMGKMVLDADDAAGDAEDRARKLHSRVSVLSRENELLKHKVDQLTLERTELTSRSGGKNSSRWRGRS